MNVAETLIIRCLDLAGSVIGLVVLSPLFGLIFLVLLYESRSPVFRQVRLGKNKMRYEIFKFRSMELGSEQTATHLADKATITPIGRLLRKTKLDELPQLLNVFRGEMSLVGPRPCLPNQYELIHEREVRRVFEVKPGITGLGQVSKIDMSKPALLAETDARMIGSLTVKLYLIYIAITIFRKCKFSCLPEIPSS